MRVLKYHPETLAPALADVARCFERLVAFPSMNTPSDNACPKFGVANPVERRMHFLMLAGLHGDSTAYHTFLSELTGHLRAFIRRRLYAMPDEVEDVVQETLLAVHNARHTYEPEQPLTAWIYAIARYKLLDCLRTRSRHAARLEPLDDFIDILADSESAPSHDAKLDVDGLLEQLPDKQRLPILHVKVQGLSVAETAKLTGLSESAVKVGIHRGLKTLAAKVRILTS